MDKEKKIKEYFDDFVDAFATYDGDRVAGKFTVPYMVKGELGESKIFHSLPEVSQHFQKYLDEYKAKGCRKCQYSNLDVKWLGSESAIASVDWSLLDQADNPVISWSESYLLSVLGDKAQAYATVDHVGS
ncbi:hypothetical protein QQM79_20655 [Marinobacteraceae bacterium S3BR75-40.1]